MESQRDIVDMSLRLELQFLGDSMAQNQMFQVENDYVSHWIEEVSKTPLRNQNQLLRLGQGQQPAGPLDAALGSKHLGGTLNRLLSSGSREKVWEGARTCYRNSARKNRHQNRKMLLPVWAFPSPHLKRSWQEDISRWVTLAALKRAFDRVDSNWDGS